VASIHRFENIATKHALERVINLVERIALRYRVLFVLHKPTEVNLRRFRLLTRLEANDRIDLRPRADYFLFIRLIAASAFVVSDGGSNQEECFYLGKPILLLRQATERPEGIGENCLLSQYDERLVADFVANVDRYRRPAQHLAVAPSHIIATHCAAFAD
jgi:UDP-N-acetylglucosamine 2-epimerase (non-hydrolysing)